MQDNYVCEETGCGKWFSRSDHLARHKTTIHSPKVFFSCHWPGCVKKFVRKDVRDKHEGRHRVREERRRNSRKIGAKHEELSENYNIEAQTSLGGMVIPNALDPSSPTFFKQSGHNVRSLAEETAELSTVDGTISGQIDFALKPPDLTQWLFNDESFLLQSGNSSPTNTYLAALDSQTEKMLEDAFCISPNFPNPNSQVSVDDLVVEKMISYVPALAQLGFSSAKAERTLSIYWDFFHVQFPILHKPSFNTSAAHPLLLLSMVMIGAAMSPYSENDEWPVLGDSRQLLETIAFPLRWLISSSDEFCSPAKPWILQSLIILETCEILFSNRRLHERAYLHHGVKMQLLRRSPLLGGDPLNRTNDDIELTEEKDAWKRWIEVESLNRVALVSFYLDTVNATIFGHQIVLFAHQIKLLMPCDDVLWEMSSIDKNNPPPQAETPKFITALTKLLHQEKLEVGALGKKILLAGLLSIKFQMELKDLEVTFLDWKSVKESWKDTIYRAIEVWRDDICQEDCCDSRNAYYLPVQPDADVPSPFLSSNTGCKYPAYHICQTFMGIKQYDCIIYVGASNRMNVKTTEKDYQVVKERIQAWANSLKGRISVLHCYMFLHELLFNGNEKLLYDPATDPIFHRPNVVASSLFVIWSYNYCLFGPESEISIGSHAPDNVVKIREDGYAYIKRICSHLRDITPEGILSNRFLDLYAEALESLTNTHCMAGLIALFKDRFKYCQSEVCREYAGLLENCMARSMGQPRKKYGI